MSDVKYTVGEPEAVGSPEDESAGMLSAVDSAAGAFASDPFPSFSLDSSVSIVCYGLSVVSSACSVLEPVSAAGLPPQPESVRTAAREIATNNECFFISYNPLPS